jgi:peptidoglycan/xylan/chitin deacetylase (PgdA/CDA1 family)
MRDISICTWKGCHRGALSISIDDSRLTCFFSLLRNNFKGSYFVVTPKINLKRAIRYFGLRILSLLGHEIGAHTVNHPSGDISADSMQKEFQDNIAEIAKRTGIASKSVISMAWPYGYAQHKDIASEYFICARGYKMNEFEDITPDDFMNLKSFDLPSQPGAKLSNLKVILDNAQEYGKWAILVFHWHNNSAIINYAKDKDLWVEPIGNIVKYILLRNSAFIKDITETDVSIKAFVCRNEVVIHKRNIEELFSPGDQVTLKVDISDIKKVYNLKVDGITKNYTLKTIDDKRYMLFDVDIIKRRARSVSIICKRKT